MNAYRRARRRVFAGLALLAAAVTNTALGADYLAMNGAELYRRFCASCHGGEGKGDGPVAKSLSVEVPDLTLLARRHQDQFPASLVERIIDGRHTIFAHGSRVMPVWGQEFFSTERGNPDAERATQVMLSRLVDYVKTLQRTPTTEAVRK